MADYNRTVWKDHIKDQDGKVIQQGVPVSAKNLNNIENQLVVLSAKENTLAELIRETIPSGFTTLSDLDYSYMATNPNTIRLLSDSIAFVNGYKVVIPAGTVIQLDVPPTSGSREDLVFLECWKQSDANGSVSWNYRIRVVDGIDFNTYPEGLSANNSLLDAQGGDNSPYSGSRFYNIGDRQYSGAPMNRKIALTDVGLSVAGDGTSSSKNNLNTTDGYIYAIPMFRVHRRNSSGYNASNGNGGVAYTSIAFTRPISILPRGTGQYIVSTEDYNNINIGDVFKSSGIRQWKVLSKDGNNAVTVINLVDMAQGTSTINVVKCDRYDLLNADIISDRDIIDLRHQVSLTGFNYQQLLEENFDKLLRGDLQTNAKMTILKTYHGIPKTPIDSNTIFYASFDGTNIPEVGKLNSIWNIMNGFRPCGTGLGTTSICYYDVDLSSSIISIDVMCASSFLISIQNPNWNDVGNGHRLLTITETGIVNFTGGGSEWTDGRMKWNKFKDIINHFRFVLNKNTKKIVAYHNGVKILDFTFDSGCPLNSTYFNSNCQLYTNYDGNNYTGVISDLSISNIDRGSTFATLPQDFIDGYARISTAFNDQRNIYSDALTSEVDFVQVKCAGGNGKAIALGDATDWAKDDGTKWNSGDRIKVKGLTGEIISGVIDSDTVIARSLMSINTSATSQILQLDNVTGIAVNDTFGIVCDGNLVPNLQIVVDSIDVNNKTVTVHFSDNGTHTASFNSSYYLVESTTTSSSPRVQYYNGSNLVDVTGTWSGLGTNEATFALGTNSNLNNQDLYITYGLNELPGQGGIPEVLTTTLSGESNGKRLAFNPSVHARDDFAGKVSGSAIVSPNTSKINTSNTSLVAPNLITNECTDDQYSTIKNLDGNCLRVSATGNGQIPQQLFSFNLIRILEDKFGTLPCGSDIASKVAWLKANINKITFSWWGYGSCPSGNKSYISNYIFGTYNSYSGSAYYSVSSTPSLLSFDIKSTNASNTPLNTIDSNGFVHLVAYTDISDGVTPSTVYTDYCNIEIMLNSGVGYDVLAPENPRRDDGKSNILLVRKETKEIVTMFPRGNNDKIITYGDYVPYQGLAENSFNQLKVLAIGKPIVSTVGTGGSSSISNAYSAISEKLPMELSSYNYKQDDFYTNDNLTLVNFDECSMIRQRKIDNTESVRGLYPGNYINLLTTTTFSPVRGYNLRLMCYDGITATVGFKNIPLNAKCFTAIPILVSYNGNIYMIIWTLDNSRGTKKVYGTFFAGSLYKVSNRILVK